MDTPTEEETGRTDTDEEDGGSIEVGVPVVHPGGMTKGRLGPEVQGVKGKIPCSFIHPLSKPFLNH